MDMSITISSPSADRIRLKARYIAAACGVALAVSTITAFAGVQGHGSSATAGGRQTVAAIPVERASNPGVAFYLVDSEADRDAILTAEADLQEAVLLSDYPGPRPAIYVFVGGSAEQANALEISINESLRELADAGTTAWFYDLRRR
jgi:hypothetical protein